ncbi:MAG: AI-2E family transporter [Gammaproteobacteria bacterium]|nr:MAG: AI-2E family transporter [Gammaproteobacteria bacterium]
MDSLSARTFWLTVTIVTGVVIYLLAPVLPPFLVAAAIAYLCDPLVDRFEACGWPRTLGVVSVFALFILLLTVFMIIAVPALVDQATYAVQQAPKIMLWLQDNAIPYLEKTFNFTWPSHERLGEWMIAHADQNIAWLKTIGVYSVSWMNFVFVIPVVLVAAFYLLRDWDHLVAFLGELVPRKHVGSVTRVVSDIDHVLSAFVRGQLLVMFALGLIYWLGLQMVGLNLAFLIGVVAGLASIVPYLGVILGLLFACVAAIVQFQSFEPLIYVGVVFAVGQMLEGFVLTPWLVGDRIGLHPVAVIFAVMAGGHLLGFTGVLIGLPLAAAIAVILRHFHQRYQRSKFYQNDDVYCEKRPVSDALAQSPSEADDKDEDAVDDGSERDA